MRRGETVTAPGGNWHRSPRNRNPREAEAGPFSVLTAVGRGDGEMSATVRDVMTTRVVAVRKNASYKDIAGLLSEYRVSAFPVLDDDGAVIGVVSEADLLSKEALIAGMPVWR